MIEPCCHAQIGTECIICTQNAAWDSALDSFDGLLKVQLRDWTRLNENESTMVATYEVLKTLRLLLRELWNLKKGPSNGKRC
jgi:hypothetical protein